MKINIQGINYIIDNHLILEEFSFNASLSGIVGVVGPSGSGKTTLLRIISGLLNPSKGQIIFNDKNISKLSVAQRPISFMQQTFPLYEQLSLYENILISFDNKTSSAKEIAEYYLRELQLKEDIWKRKPKSLSGGEKQRVAFIKAIMKPADIFLMDEPFSNLDKYLKSKASSLFVDFVKTNKKLCFYVSHDESEIILNSDKIIYLDNGRIIQESDSDNLFSNPINSSVASFGNELGLQIVDINNLKQDVSCDFHKSTIKIGWLPTKSTLITNKSSKDTNKISFPVKVDRIKRRSEKYFVALKFIANDSTITLWHQEHKTKEEFKIGIGSEIWLSVQTNDIFQLDNNNLIIK
jgi:ABC-type sugar transport system ATPase subunit